MDKFANSEQLYSSPNKINDDIIMECYIKNINVIYSGKINNEYLYKIQSHRDRIEIIISRMIQQNNKIQLIKYITYLIKNKLLPNRWHDPYYNIINLAIHTSNDDYTLFVMKEIIPMLGDINENIFFHQMVDDMIKLNLINSLKCFVSQNSFCKNQIFDNNSNKKNRKKLLQYININELKLYDCGNGQFCICE